MAEAPAGEEDVDGSYGSSGEGVSADEGLRSSLDLFRAAAGLSILSPHADTVSKTFSNLPQKFLQILGQGAKKFQDFFSPHQLEITRASQLSARLRYFNESVRVEGILFHRNGLTIEASGCEEKLIPKPLRMVRPDAQLERHLSFPPGERIAPCYLGQWMQQGSIFTAVDAMAR